MAQHIAIDVLTRALADGLAATDRLACFDEGAAGLLALRANAPEVLSAYALATIHPPVSLLKRILASVIAIPTLPSGPNNLDRATALLLDHFGVQGVHAPSEDAEVPLPLLRWATCTRMLATPGVNSPEARKARHQRRQLWEEVSLAILELDIQAAASGLRWLSVAPISERRDHISGALMRVRQLALDNWQVQFDCTFAMAALSKR